ncbi:MAG: type II secretion system protein GspE [Deltaproteobacteria bacterium]|nr:MAG: type II secretion system protein GspE [Deltaproteobacteria bacterium]
MSESKELLVSPDTEGPVVRLVHLILEDAYRKRATEIFIEPYEKILRVRYRLDGVLTEVMHPPKKLQAAMAARLKVIGKLDIAERRLPQDGLFSLSIESTTVDFQISMIPTRWGETILIRLLHRSRPWLPGLLELGLSEKQLADLLEAHQRRQGLVVACGPTFAGKTTTLYSLLQHQYEEDPQRSFATIEVAIHAYLEGVEQSVIHPDIGLNASSMLRAHLNRRPDVLLVHELRDFEVSTLAMQAAMQGMQVLTTLHTHDAASTYTRLLNMGLESYMVADSLTCVIAQRVGRRICASCKEPADESDDSVLSVGIVPDELNTFTPMKGRGCVDCLGSGYKGRVGFFEVLPVTSQIRELILRRASTKDIRQAAREEGVASMRRSALDAMKRGETTLQEVVLHTQRNRDASLPCS